MKIAFVFLLLTLELTSARVISDTLTWAVLEGEEKAECSIAYDTDNSNVRCDCQNVVAVKVSIMDVNGFEVSYAYCGSQDYTVASKANGTPLYISARGKVLKRCIPGYYKDADSTCMPLEYFQQQARIKEQQARIKEQQDSVARVERYRVQQDSIARVERYWAQQKEKEPGFLAMTFTLALITLACYGLYSAVR